MVGACRALGVPAHRFSAPIGQFLPGHGPRFAPGDGGQVDGAVDGRAEQFAQDDARRPSGPGQVVGGVDYELSVFGQAAKGPLRGPPQVRRPGATARLGRLRLKGSPASG